MNKADYNKRVQDLIDDGAYVKVANPLSKMIADHKETVKKTTTLGDEIKRRWLVSNPRVPAMYALPKIHKPCSKMRPIVSNINSVN